jgi:hypothetical protein
MSDVTVTIQETNEVVSVTVDNVTENVTVSVSEVTETVSVVTGDVFYGEKGDKGDKGDTGDQGIQGLKGDTGDTGAQGIQGIQGLKGDKGDTGDTGIQGIKGDTGNTGATGTNGADGVDGLSAYEVAISNGFIGNEAAWLASLVGATGAQGIQGIQGIKGDTGDTGLQGIQGIQGIQGEMGSTGSPGSNGTNGTNGAGVIVGGVQGDILEKIDGTDFNTQWATVKGGAANLAQRLNTISNFASPNAGGVVTGQYYDNSFQGTASSTLAGAANRIELAPYYTSVPLSINQIGCNVSTGVASAEIKIVIYSSDANGWPDLLLYESAGIAAATNNAYANVALTFTFSSGVQYWVGVRHSSTATLRTINVSSAVNLGLTSATASNYATVLRRTLTYATAATSPWNFVNSDRVANITPPSIRFRAE